jgi:hypothetical protein
MASYNWQEIGDPLRVFHDAKKNDAPNQGEWNSLLKQGNALYDAPQNTNSTAGQDAMLAASADPANQALLTGSRDYNNRILSGEFLDPNKNLQLAQQLQRGYEGIGGWDAGAETSGRYGSGAWAQGRGREMADLKANLYGQGLDRMQTASMNAGSIFAQQLAPGQLQDAIGQERDQYSQNAFQNKLGLLGTYQSGTPTTYSGNKVMGGIGAAIGIIGAVKGAGGNGNKVTNTNTPQYPNQTGSTYYNTTGNTWAGDT